MLTTKLKIVSALAIVAALPTLSGCAACKGSCGVTTRAYKSNSVAYAREETPVFTKTTTVADLPPNAVAGECYAKVFVPPQFNTVSERVCIQEAQEKLEVIPAQYEWKEKRVEIRPSETRLEITPAQLETRAQTVLVKPESLDWVHEVTAKCESTSGQPVRDVFCLVNQPPQHETITTQVVVNPATVRKIEIPAEFEIVREQCLVSAATTRTITIAAEFKTIDKTVKVADGGMRWERVVCEGVRSTERVNEIKGALLAHGYTPGASYGQLDQQDWIALNAFQQKNGLGVGELTYETLDKLGVSTGAECSDR